MSYKIAIGSSNGKNIDLKFGEVDEFLIYEVDEEAKLLEKRTVKKEQEKNNNPNISALKCGNKSGCGNQGNGCSGSENVISKVSIIADCRCVVCKKIGFQAQKQFEKKAISVFDVECSVKDALEKITFYYKKIDNHESFRKVL